MGSIEAALAECDTYENPIYAQIAEKHGVKRSTLSRRHKGVIGSRAEYKELYSLLNNTQAKRLINEINQFSNYNTPPTVAIVRAFAFNICGNLPGIHWAECFVKAYANKLKSVYLRGFNLS